MYSTAHMHGLLDSWEYFKAFKISLCISHCQIFAQFFVLFLFLWCFFFFFGQPFLSLTDKTTSDSWNIKNFLVIIFGKNSLERGIRRLHRVSSKSRQRMTSPKTGAFLQDVRSNSDNSENGAFRELQIHLSQPGDIRMLIFTTTIFVTLDFLDYYRGERDRIRSS